LIPALRKFPLCHAAMQLKRVLEPSVFLMLYSSCRLLLKHVNLPAESDSHYT
jgi:hypothetical protein